MLLDLAVSPLFAWAVFTASFARDLGIADRLVAGVFSVGLVAFMAGVLVGVRVADAIAPRRIALVTAAGTVAVVGNCSTLIRYRVASRRPEGPVRA